MRERFQSNGDTRRDTRVMCALRDNHVTRQQEGKLLQAKREALEKTNLPSSLSYMSHLQNCEKINLCCLSHLLCEFWYGSPSKLIHYLIHKPHSNVYNCLIIKCAVKYPIKGCPFYSVVMSLFFLIWNSFFFFIDLHDLDA